MGEAQLKRQNEKLRRKVSGYRYVLKNIKINLDLPVTIYDDLLSRVEYIKRMIKELDLD